MEFVKPILFTEAIEKLGARNIVTSQLTSREWASVPVGLRERAFFSSRVESARFLQRGKDFLEDFLTGARETVTGPDGIERTALKAGSRAQFVKEMSEFARREGLGPLDPRDSGTIKDIRSESRLQLIFDTQTRQAQDFGFWKQGMDKVVLNEYPAQRFVRERAVKEARHRHSLFENHVALKTNVQFWLSINQDFHVPWGPWGWGCGHGVEDVDRDEAEELGLLGPLDVLDPVDKSFNDDLEASTRGLDAEMVDFLRGSFGDQIRIEDGSVKWSKDSTDAPAPVDPVPSSSRRKPVSAGLDVKLRGELKGQVQNALGAIDQVHDDGDLPKIPLERYHGRWALGVFQRTLTGSRNIGIKPTGTWPALTTVHEVGHFLDWEVLGPSHTFGSRTESLKSVMEAIKASRAFTNLRQRYSVITDFRLREHLGYMMSSEELWARAYAQFIAVRSGSVELKKQLAAALNSEPDRQWESDDFEPIAKAIETFFKSKNWM